MSFTYYKIFIIKSLLILTAAYSIKAQIGFQANLDTPPSFVSPYYEPADIFSVAIAPRSSVYLSSRLKPRPHAVSSNFQENSIRFNTSYYSYGRIKKSLIPVSVDADKYINFLMDKNINENFLETSRRSITDIRKQKRRGGLGISVNLPKRLGKIFGEGGAGLKVSGFRKVSLAGRSQWTDAAESETFQQNKFPSLRMEQVSRFDITGTIGTKITVKVSQDSQRDIPLANRIQIRYKGDEDDILKTIEAGNTTLSLPNTKFVGYTSRIRGLFGLKAMAQMGNLSITGIASQEKGSTERATFTATGKENAEHIRDYEYVTRRIFDLGREGELARFDSVVTLFVYETISGTSPDLEANFANLYVNPNFPDSFPAENIISGGNVRVKQLSRDSYIFYNDPDRNLHYVVLNSSRSSTYHLGYWMVVKRANGQIDTVGNITGETYDLKLLSLSDSKASPEQETWGLMWRNCYRIPKGVSVDDIDLKVFNGLVGSEGSSSSFDYQESNGQTVRYIELLGLDQYNAVDKKVPDNLLDDLQDVFRSDWGLVIFPHRQPFASDTTFTDDNGVETPQLEDQVPTLYNYTSPIEKSENSKYYIQLSTKTRSSIIKLNRANIIEGSERITLNGRLLTRGTDYNVQYDFGQITLLTPEASDPNADIDIDYEYAPFFAVQKKSLLGVRAEYEWSKDFKFGTTFLYKSDKAQERKPKVGQETARTIIFDTDLSLKLHPNFLTKLVDALPLIESEAPSNMSISAEIAQSHPNPNVNDEAYVDDFESALDKLSLGTSRTIWKIASKPFQLDSNDYERGKVIWHTPRELVQVEDVYDREAKQGEGTIRTLRMVYRPKNVKVDTVQIDSVTSQIDTVAVNSWAGVMRYFNSRVDADRAQLFEVRARGAHGLLHFDFGVINEDINNNGLADSEDKDLNEAVDEDEDVGLDGLLDDEEPGYDPITNPDPSGDNWYFLGDGKCPFGSGGCDTIDWDDDRWYYEFLNGTEGNFRDPGVLGIPDEEVLSLGSGFETNDAYFSYVIDFASDSFLVENSKNDRGWRTYRIPIRDSTVVDSFVVSNPTLIPNWNQITHVRVWFESDSVQTTPDTIEVADWYFVQSNWQDSVIYGENTDSSTTFFVASVSEEDNTSFTPPPGVEAYRDPTDDVIEAQRALLLNFANLDHNDSCMVTKDLLTVDRYSGYRRLQMYVYGSINEADTGKVQFFFRLGKDANNFYEYRSMIYPGWDERNYVNIDFNEITALKDAALRNLESGNVVDTTDGPYHVFGKPNVNEVRYFEAGVINLDTTSDISGELWLDELRVTDVRKDVGTAGRVSISGNLADLLTYNFSLDSKDPYFRGLSSATRGGSSNNLGSGKTETRYSYGVTLNIHKFLPRSWGSRIPVSFSYSKSVRTPLLRNNSDIVLPEEIRIQEQNISESKSFSVSGSFNRKGKNPLFNLLLNRLKTSFSYRRSKQKTVNLPYSFGENYNIKSDFNFGIKKVPTIPIFFWTKWIPILKKTAGSRLSLYPEQWTTSGNYSRNLTVSDDVNDNRRSSIKRDFVGNMRITYKILGNLSTTYNYDTRRDLSDLELVNISSNNFKLGLETHYGQRFGAKYDPSLFNFFTSSFSYSAAYTDDWERSNKSRRSKISRSTSVSGKFDHIAFLGGKSSKSAERRFRGGGRRGSSRRNKEQQKEEVEKKKPFYDPPLAVLRFLTNWITPLSYSYSETYNNSLPGMAVRPDWKYRFGIKKDAEVSIISDVRTQSASEGVSYDFSSGFTLFGGLVTTVKFKESISRDLIKQGPRYESISTSWPDLSIRIQKFKYLPLIKKYVNKFIDVFAPRTGFSRQIKESRDIDGGFKTSRSVNTNYSPLLSISLKLFRSLSLSTSYTHTENKKENYNPSNGDIQSETNSVKNTFALTSQYSFTSPHGISIPIFGKIKFRSTVDFNMTVKMNSSKTETSNNGGPFRSSVDKSDISFSPRISYTFSQQIKGGLTLRWQDTKDHYRNRDNHTREVQIWTEIRF